MFLKENRIFWHLYGPISAPTRVWGGDSGTRTASLLPSFLLFCHAGRFQMFSCVHAQWLEPWFHADTLLHIGLDPDLAEIGRMWFVHCDCVSMSTLDSADSFAAQFLFWRFVVFAWVLLGRVHT